MSATKKWTTNISRPTAEQHPVSGAALISMTDPRSKQPKLVGWGPTLRLRFHDRNERQAHFGMGYVVPTRSDAIKIVDFIMEHPDKIIIAHCEKGISRSGAVARLLHEMGWDYLNPGTCQGPYARDRVNGYTQAHSELYQYLRAEADKRDL